MKRCGAQLWRERRERGWSDVVPSSEEREERKEMNRCGAQQMKRENGKRRKKCGGAQLWRERRKRGWIDVGPSC
jgi:hypothetical protein